jgi:hypothetical protein
MTTTSKERSPSEAEEEGYAEAEAADPLVGGGRPRRRARRGRTRRGRGTREGR